MKSSTDRKYHTPIFLLCGLLGFFVYSLGKYIRYKAITHTDYMQPNIAWYKSADDYSFRDSMCKERKYLMNWEEILAPCKEHFQDNNLARTLATDASISRIVSQVIRPVGDYSKITIQTYDKSGRAKSIGGDEWRVSIRGPSEIEAIVRDMENGQYETSFLLLEAGLYKVEFTLHDTLCDSFMDPPVDWLRAGSKF